MYRSDDEVLELFAVSEGLLSEEVSENGDNDVVGVVRGVLNDGIGKEEDNSDILEAVGGKQESNSFPFDDVSDFDSRLVLVAFVQHLLSLLQKREDFNLELKIVVLDYLMFYVLELFKLGINFGLNEVESFSDALVLSGNFHGLVEG